MTIPKITVKKPDNNEGEYILEEIIFDIPNQEIRFVYEWDRFTKEYTIPLKRG
jgi:hypothetical protein